MRSKSGEGRGVRSGITRRSALGGLLAAAAGAGKARGSRAAVKPKRLRPGDTVGLAAPSGASWEDEDVRFSTELIESLGFRVKPGRHVFERKAYFAGSDSQRGEDLNRLFADPEVDGIFAMRGGYGAQRILPLLDYELIAGNPKVLLGYSDITALHCAIQKRTGLTTFHGPMPGANWSEYSLGEFRKVVQEPTASVRIGQAPPFEAGAGQVERENRVTTIRGGKARGRLIGGNLTLLSTLTGTPFAPDYAGRILFFEDVDEAPYRVDRMLTHLWLAGSLEACAGIAVGKFTEATPGRGRSRSLEEILTERLRPLGVPVIRGSMIGHIGRQTVVPIGVEAELDADAGSLRLLEPAVV